MLKAKTKILIGFIAIVSIVAIASVVSINLVNAEEPTDDDPSDPGNSPGPGNLFGAQETTIGNISPEPNYPNINNQLAFS